MPVSRNWKIWGFTLLQATKQACSCFRDAGRRHRTCVLEAEDNFITQGKSRGLRFPLLPGSHAPTPESHGPCRWDQVPACVTGQNTEESFAFPVNRSKPALCGGSKPHPSRVLTASTTLRNGLVKCAQDLAFLAHPARMHSRAQGPWPTDSPNCVKRERKRVTI